VDRRPLGRTGLTVPALCLGGAAIGQQYGPVSVAEVRDTVDAALGAGIDFVDTSAYYGRGESERILGEVLSGRRDRVTLCTKAGRLDRDVFDFTPAGVRACVEGSLQRLRTDRVDILLAHDIEFADDPERVFAETVPTLHEMKRAGRCRFVGVSGLPLALLRQAVERCELDVVMSYCHFTLQNDRLLTELLPACEERGVGVLNASPLAMGLLTPGGPPPWHPAGDDIKRACRQAGMSLSESMVEPHDIAELGMWFCAAETRFATVTGTAKRAELEANLRAIQTPPDPAALGIVRAELAAVHGKSWPSGRWAAASGGV
jgi:L-galactose dehydrogenase